MTVTTSGAASAASPARPIPRRVLSAVAILALAAASLVVPNLVPEYSVRLLNLALIASVAVMGLVVAFGWAGLIHLGQAVFVGIGAYTASILSQRFGFGFWTALPFCLVMGTLVSALIGWPLLRLRGHYLAFATAGLNVTSDIIIRNWVSLTGGNDGLIGMAPVSLFGFELYSDLRFFYFAWCVVALLILAIGIVRHSHFGRAILATRDDELAASVGTVPVYRIRLLAFTVCGFFGALSGALYAPYAGYISPADFDLIHSTLLVVMMVVGGEVSAVGAVLGAVIIGFLPEWLRFVGDAYLVIFGIGVILVLIFMRGGITGALCAIPAAVRHRWGKSHA